MRDLAELQGAMTEALLSGDAAPLAGELILPNADALRRFSIFRNNTFLSLTRHLEAVFPVTARLGDERFFRYAAFEFVKAHPPREPLLSRYGSALPRFLAKFPACRSAPILPEMASLEWAVHSALTAAEHAPLAPSVLAEIGQSAPNLRLMLQPSLHFAVARWPLLPLWQGTHAEDRLLDRRITRTAIFRSADRVRFAELSSSRFAFWHSLARREQLECAAARALARDPMFGLVEEILALFRAGLVIAVDDSMHTDRKAAAN
jgi:hypothetical protein